MLILNKDPRERKQMKLEELLYEAYDKADWSKICPPLDQNGCHRLDEIQVLVGRATARIAKIRKYAEESGNAELIGLLDYLEREKKEKS